MAGLAYAVVGTALHRVEMSIIDTTRVAQSQRPLLDRPSDRAPNVDDGKALRQTLFSLIWQQILYALRG